MNRAAIVVLLVACRTTPSVSRDAAADVAPIEASTDASATTTTLEEEEEETADAGEAETPCPRPVHPGWCRNRCRTFGARKTNMHADRMQHVERVAIGKCGAFDVFAEDERAGDGGVQSGIIEYFDATGALVAASDTRMKPCGQFGAVPSCKPQLTWQESRSIHVDIGPVVSPKLPAEVIVRILRQNVGRYRMCAKNTAGASRPVGRVVAKIAIAADGSVTSAEDDGSDLQSKDTIACVLHATQLLVFPQPEGGAITVRVPIAFSH